MNVLMKITLVAVCMLNVLTQLVAICVFAIVAMLEMELTAVSLLHSPRVYLHSCKGLQWNVS